MIEDNKDETRSEDEALLALHDIFQPEALKCQNGSKITHLCINSNCEKYSFLNNHCRQCEENHSLCSLFPLKGITKLLTDRAAQQKNFLMEINSIEKEFVRQLYKSRRTMTNKYYLGDLEDKYVMIIQEIYKKGNAKSLIGKDAKEFFQRVMKSGVQQADHQSKKLLDEYKRSMDKIIKNMIDLKLRLYDSFVKPDEINRASISNQIPIVGPAEIKLTDYLSRRPNPRSASSGENRVHPGFRFDSHILSRSSDENSSKEFQSQVDFIRQSLNNPKALQLLFRASQHDFRAPKFHQKCDYILNTFILVRTEHQKTIGAFTHIPWTNRGQKIEDKQKKSFLLSIDNKQKLTPLDRTTIGCANSCGPIFGGMEGNDLYISDNCNRVKNSSSHFPKHYNRLGSPYLQTQGSLLAFTGSPYGFSFRVLEYEVFKVVYE